MQTQLKQQLDAILQSAAQQNHVAGVVAGLTNQDQTIYLNHAGKRDLSSQVDMRDDSVFAIFSTTKAITTTLALQQYENGLLDLDAPARLYLPEIAELQVLQGFGAQNQPLFSAAKNEITTRMLLLHTAGLGYDFFNADYLNLTTHHGYPSVISATKAALKTPLLFEPGSQWQYGANIDWAGLVIEAVGGKRLGTLMQEQIFNPCNSAGFPCITAKRMAV